MKILSQGQNVIVLAILEGLEFRNFTFQTVMLADNTFQLSAISSTLKGP